MKVNQIITEQFINCLKEGTIPWRKPWACGGFCNGFTKRPYRGINILTLAFFGKGEYYFTFKQVVALGGNVKKGSKGIPIAFYTPLKSNEGKANEKTFPLLRYYKVFAWEDTEGMKWEAPKKTKAEIKPIELCEKFVAAQKASIEFVGSRAVYLINQHKIQMPVISAFDTAEHFYSTMFHELTHREAREVGEPLDPSTFGSDPYAKEELIAEIGAAFTSAYCGVRNDAVLENEKAYIQSWISKLEKDPQLILTAASKAQKRFDSMQNKFDPKAKIEDTTDTKGE